MTSLKSECRKFAPNIFNKSKCQNCFRTKESHSAEALESSRSTRKISKCGYLFVAPDWDFSIPINRTKRWQRRWFVLYDDGELTYSVDEHPDTVPQAVIDMNKVLEVTDAQEITGNEFAIAITAPEKVHFIKGTSREESKWWFDVLSKLPRNNMRYCGKHKRNATFPGGKATSSAIVSDHESNLTQTYCPTEEDGPGRPRFTSESRICQREDDWTGWLHHQVQEDDVFPTKEYSPKNATPTVTTVSNNDMKDGKFGIVDEKLVKKEVFKVKDEAVVNKKGHCRRYQKRENRNHRSQRSRSDGVAKMIPSRDFSQGESSSKTFVNLSLDRLSSPIPLRRRHTSDKAVCCIESGQEDLRQNSENSNLLTPSLPVSRSLKKSESLKNIATELSPEMKHDISELKRNHSYKGTAFSKKELTKENSCSSFIQPVKDVPSKSQVSSTEVQNDNSPSRDAEVDICSEGMVLKKGWLLRRSTILSKDEWSKYWFVLKNASFTYYRDPSAEDCGILDGVLDLNQVTNIECIETENHFAFSLTMWDNKKHILSTISSAARQSWMKAIQCASNLWDAKSRKDFSNDEIILPEHNFFINEISEKNAEQMQDMSSSDDQSEYFSIIDDGEDDVGVGERASSPQTLPPSPPLNRTPMSLVKERSRGRSNSYSCSFVAQTTDDDVSEQGISDIGNTDSFIEDSYQEVISKHVDRDFQTGMKEDQDFSEELEKENTCLRKQNIHDNFKTGATDESITKILETDAFEKLKYKYPKLSDTQLISLLNNSEINLSSENSGISDDYKLKYELLKAKYMQDRLQWQFKAKKEKSISLKGSNLGSYMKILQKTKRTVYELKEKFCSSGVNTQSTYITATKDLQQLCKEIEKMSPYYEKKVKREGDAKKWKRGFTQLQLLSENLQKSLHEEQSQNSVLAVEIKKQARTIESLEQEIQSLKKKQLNVLTSQHQNSCSDNNNMPDVPDVDMRIICKTLSDKLKIADEQVRMIKKDLRDSHRNMDDLEIYCFQLKRDAKFSEEIHQSQMALMTARVDDLTSKLSVSERNLRQLKQKLTKLESKQERRRSSLKSKESISLSKECEAKLFDLEQKLATIENDLKFQDKIFAREGDITSSVECERALSKRLSQDSSSSENAGSLLLRLHTLSLNTKVVSDAMKKQMNTNESPSFDKPKICLQLRSEEEIIGHEQKDDCGEDWNTLSYTTSLTDLQTIDGSDSCEFPNSWPEVSERLEEKLESLFTWLKFSIHGLQKQEVLDTQNGKNTDSLCMTSSILEVLDCISDIKTEHGSSSGYEPTRTCCKAFLLSDMSETLHKIINFESCHILGVLWVCQHSFNFMLMHLKYLCDVETQSSADMMICYNLIKKLLSISCVTYNRFLNNYLEDTTHQSCNRILLLQQNCAHLMMLLDEAKNKQFSIIMQTLADIPVQDQEVSEVKNILYSEYLFEFDPLLLHITTIVRMFCEIAEYQLCEIDQQELSLLECNHKAWIKWSTNLQKSLKEELLFTVEEIKESYQQVREKNAFPCGLNCTSYKKIIHISVAFARITLLRIVLQNIHNFLSDENISIGDNTDSKEWIQKLQEHYCLKASLCGEKIKNYNTDFYESLFLSHILETGMREMKNGSVFLEVHQRKIESLHQELELLSTENAKLKSACEASKIEIQNLQVKLEHLIAKECCEKCQTLERKLHAIEEHHEADLITLDKECKKKIEQVQKHLQFVLEQKDDVHSQDIKRLEQQLQTAQKISSHLEVEYNLQVQNLKAAYQHKLCMEQEPINEESVRKKYQIEIEQLKNLWEKGLTAVQNSYKQMTVELDMRHKQEISMLEAEKEKLLKEETQATIAALEVMKKFHAEELQREIARYKEEFLTRIQPNKEIGILHEKRVNELEEIKHEIMLLSEKYTVKCLENASLEEKVHSLHRQLQEANQQVFDLTARNKQLNVHLAVNIAEIKEWLNNYGCSAESLENLKILLQLKENEIAKQKEESALSKQDLHLAQMHASMLDVQCEQLYQSLNAERKLREEVVNNLWSRLEAIITASLIHADESAIRCSETRGRGSKFWNRTNNCLYRTPSLTFIPNSPLDKLNISVDNMTQTRELYRSPSWPHLDLFK